MTVALDDGMNQICEPGLLFIPTLQRMDTICALYDEHVRANWWKFSFDKMSIFFARVVASVQNFQTIHVDEEHASSKNMSCVIRSESDSRADGDELMD